MNILDGIKTANIKITKEMQKLSELVKDKSLLLIDRIESYEDIINIDIGDTSLIRSRNIESDLVAFSNSFFITSIF